MYLKLCVLPLSVLMLLACKKLDADKTTIKQPETSELTTTQQPQVPEILVGKKERKDIEAEPYGSLWYQDNYQQYVTDKQAIKKLKKALKPVSKLEIFMGTWCGDSKREVPRMFKILDEAGFDFEKLTLITVTRDKDTPEGYETDMDITNVPTFIFYENGKETNRIVELPVESLEKDMISILGDNNYKHIYAK